MKKTRIALYGRVSTKDGRQETENQLHQLREYCVKQGWEIVGEFIDHESGKSSKRVHFQRMFSNAREHKFDLVLFWSLDRLSREGAFETLQHLQRLTQAGVGWKSFTEQYLDSTGIFRDAVISILATVAKQERVRQSERILAGLARAKRQGKTFGRPRQVVDGSNATKLHQQGHSLRQIAAKLGISHMSASRILKKAATV